MPLTAMTSDEYAAFERTVGREKLVLAGGLWWRQVRPFFYRPLLVFHEYDPQSASGPRGALVAAVQHLVPAGASSNSTIGLLTFQNARNYSVAALDYNRRRQLKHAEAQLSVRPIEDAKELVRKGHAVFVDFHDRTGYEYLVERRSPRKFQLWAERVFDFPNTLVLGAYLGANLCALCILQAVGDTLIYSTFFCDSEGLRYHAADLMLHSARQRAAECGQVSQVFVGLHHGGQGTDQFYLLRGATHQVRRAWLRINAMARVLMPRLLPEQYRRLLGQKCLTGDDGVAARIA